MFTGREVLKALRASDRTIQLNPENLLLIFMAFLCAKLSLLIMVIHAYYLCFCLLYDPLEELIVKCIVRAVYIWMSAKNVT